MERKRKREGEEEREREVDFGRQQLFSRSTWRLKRKVYLVQASKRQLCVAPTVDCDDDDCR